MEVDHFSHFHTLKLSEKDFNEKVWCFGCEKRCCGPTYGCNYCQFFIHKSCTELPRKIIKPFHPHPLTLKTAEYFHSQVIECHACRKTCRGFLYCCDECDFNLDVECSFSVPSKESEVHDQKFFRHCLQMHPLALSVKNDDHEFYCVACKKRCSGQTIGCGLCKFFLHRSCAELPQEIQHQSHQSHPLILFCGDPGEFRFCRACLKDCSDFCYRCDKCNFILDVECASVKPTIHYKAHSHLLNFMENIYGDVSTCNACNKTICESSSLFRCVECDFNLHLLCGPLPCLVKHKCHIDPLTLVDSLVEGDTDEFCCDACEEERDPRICVYYCEDCTYVAHVDCVFSEVKLSLKGERGSVELRTVGRQIVGKVISEGLVVEDINQNEAEQDSDTRAEEEEIELPLILIEFFSSFTEDEVYELEDFLEAAEMGMPRTGRTLSEGQKEDGISKFPPFSDEAFTELIARLDSSMLDLEGLFNYEETEMNILVKVKDYMVIMAFVPFLKDLLAKYGDISAESMLSARPKSLFVNILCSVVHRMCTTRVLDITEGLLSNWWKNLELLQLAGFKVQFAKDHLNRVVRAYFGLQARKFEDETLAELDQELAQLDQELAQLSEEMKKLTAKMEAIEGKREKHITYMKSAKSNLMKECLSDASALKWKPAAEGIL